MDEEKKEKLKKVVSRLRTINNKIENLKSSISKANETVKKNLKINDKGVKESTLNEACNGLTQASKNIKGSIIPSLNNKINS